MDRNRAAHAVVDELLATLDARAAGLWRVEGDQLAQAAFAACADMPAEVARAFATATRSVPITEHALGIVAAVTTCKPCVSRVSELDPAEGSGRWLRAFGAERSVAVPLVDDRGTVVAVLSVALAAGALADDAAADRIRAAGQSLGA